MSKPDDIPQDVWDAAEKPAFRVKMDAAAGQWWDIHPTIARAIMAERERCANVAEADNGLAPGGAGKFDFGPNTARRIASAIRNPSQTGKE